MAKQELQSEEISKKLNSEVFKVLTTNDALIGFERAYLIATAAAQLKELLTTEYMKPIMALQNNRLGFKTDKEVGYSEAVVKNCLIEAVLTGVQPFGNQFNIIAGNMYVTTEWFGHLLSNFRGLSYEIIPGLPRIKDDKTSAAVLMKVLWSLNGEKKEREIDIPVKMNQYQGVDAVLGKATRKARAWLFNTISGTEVGDGDVQDVDYKVAQDTKQIAKNPEHERMLMLINESKTLGDLQKLMPDVEFELMEDYKKKEAELMLK